MSEALFVPEDGRFLPTELYRGPWSPDAQHGGPPAALLARAVERFGGSDEMQVVRLTVELLRPVPLAPLALAASFARPGRKVQLVEAVLRAGDVEVARALALRIRRLPLALPPDLAAGPAPPPGPERGAANLPPWGEVGGAPAYHRDAVEHRFVAGGFDRPGPATDWIRLRVPLVAGVPTSPLSRVAAAADFGNGVSWVLSRAQGYRFINPARREPAVGRAWPARARAAELAARGTRRLEKELRPHGCRRGRRRRRAQGVPGRRRDGPAAVARARAARSWQPRNPLRAVAQR